MATRMQQRKGTAAQWISTNGGDGPILNAGEIGYESDTNKFKIGDGINHWVDLNYFLDAEALGGSIDDYIPLTDKGAISGVAALDASKNVIVPGTSIIVEGTTDNTNETTLTVADPTADRTITFPDANGTVLLADGSGNVTISGDLTVSGTTTTINSTTINATTGIIFEGTTANDFETTVTVANPTADRTITFPDSTGTVALTTDVTNHSSLTTNVHGITDAAELATKTFAANLLVNATKSNIAITGDKDGLVITAENGVADSTTDNLTEGSTNKYFTDERAQDALGNALGSGLSYNDTTGAISVDTTTIQARVADVSDTEIGYLNGVTSAIQTQLDAKSTASKTETFTNKSISLATNTVTGTTAEFNSALSDSNFVTTGDTGTVTSTMIVDGTIVDGDINASAAIAQSKISGLTTDLAAKLALAGGTMTGALTLSGAPSSDLHAATKAYVDGVSQGLHIHASAVAATTANITLATAVENGDTLDGVTLATGNRILIKNQTTQSENGIYTVNASGAPTRATDFDSPIEIDGGDFIFVTGGTVNDNTGWVQTNTVGTIGTDAIAFTQFSGAGTYVAGTGLTLTGNTFSINTGTTVDLSTAQTLTNKTINGSNNTISNIAISTAVSGLGTGVATFLGTPSSANLISAITDETGTGALVFGTSPTIATPILTLSSTTSTASGRIAFDATNDKIIVGDGTSAIEFAPSTTLINPQTASYTLVAADKDKMVEMSVASANNLTVPLNSSVPYAIGTKITVVQTGTGQTTIAPTGGVTINGTPGLKLRAQWSAVTLVKRATDTWVAFGDLTA
jgi:hypothetical protein